MAFERTKEIEFNETKFQLRKMDPRTASWIAVQILTKMLPGKLDEEVTGAVNLPANRSNMSEAEFHNIQDHCLAVCFRAQVLGDQVSYLPVVQQGRFTDPEMAYDVLSVMGLTVHALIFNLAPFFQDDALKSLLGSFPEEVTSRLFKASQ